MNKFEINDIRTSSEFKGMTFSQYKKSDVKTQFLKSLNKNKIEEACYWSAELVCSGHFIDLWDYIIFYFGKHIHLGNPKIITYLDKRFSVFSNIMKQGHYVNELDVRNNMTIRQIFAEIMGVFNLSKKKNSTEIVKVIREQDYDMTLINSKLKATSLSFADVIYRPDDPKELFIAINEFSYHISSKNMLDACYWYEWVIDFNTLCNKNKDKSVCESRDFVNVENKYRNDCIWMLWDVLIYYANDNPFTKALMKSTFNMFSIRYTTASCKKRRYLFYFAISLLTEDYSTNTIIISDKNYIKSITDQINVVYKQIKKNEISPNTEYLFNNLEQDNNLEKSLMKMKLLNSVDTMTNEYNDNNET